MNKEKLNLHVFKILKNILNEKIDINSSQSNCKNWDSMAYLSILTSLEKYFKIKITQKNFNSFHSVKNIIKIIKKNEK